jgi:hypothetical protein
MDMKLDPPLELSMGMSSDFETGNLSLIRKLYLNKNYVKNSCFFSPQRWKHERPNWQHDFWQ